MRTIDEIQSNKLKELLSEDHNRRDTKATMLNEGDTSKVIKDMMKEYAIETIQYIEHHIAGHDSDGAWYNIDKMQELKKQIEEQ